jgi:hypothetical protein
MRVTLSITVQINFMELNYAHLILGEALLNCKLGMLHFGIRTTTIDICVM